MSRVPGRPMQIWGCVRPLVSWIEWHFYSYLSRAKYLFITEFRYDAIWVLSWVTNIKIRVILNVYAVCTPSLPHGNQPLLHRRVTRGEKGAFPLSNVTANIESMSWNFHDRVKPIVHSTKLIAGILTHFCVRADCWMLWFVEERRANT